MTQTGPGTWTLTITGVPVAAFKYKFTLGSWNTVEETSSCGDLANRTFGFNTANASYTANNTVTNYIVVPIKPTASADGDHTFTVSLSGSTAHGQLVVPSTISITITNINAGFSFTSPGPGNYRWQCFVPCGLGWLYGNGGPMSTLGYMGGFMQVAT